MLLHRPLAFLLAFNAASTSTAFVVTQSTSIGTNGAHFSSRLGSATTDIQEPDIIPEAESKVEANDELMSLEEKRRLAKESLFGLIGTKKTSASSIDGAVSANGFVDLVLADPVTKESLKLSAQGTLLGGQSQLSSPIKLELRSAENTYEGRPNTYYDLLRSSSVEAKRAEEETKKMESVERDDSENQITDLINNLRVFLPPPIRNVLSTTGVLPGDDYIPMRDLFTSPQVSFAYERGWRQGFVAAGFPGADEEASLVQTFFGADGDQATKTVVDMSCATGLFTRRLAKSGQYDRVIGCDYSDSMLKEARRRIQADPDLTSSSATSLDLVRCDVGDIPMVSESVDALHAGAAMHCWPDLDAALGEIHRVLKPGGKFFASTFLAEYFRNVAALGDSSDINQMAFQYFESTDVLRDMVVKAGFEESKVEIEILGAACAIIRAEK